MEKFNFYDVKQLQFLNIVYALDIDIKRHFADMLFGGDQSRVIYASNAYALRKRANGTDLSNLDLPFMNFRMTTFQEGDQGRLWFNHIANAYGLYVPELERKVRYTPVTINYEATVWYHTWIDTVFAQSELIWDASNETILKPLLDVYGTETPVQMSFFAGLGYNLNFNPQYNENDWLTQNKISSIQVDPEFETMVFKDNFNISIPEKVIFNFLVDNGIETGTPEENFEALIDHFNEEVGEFEKI